MTNVTTTREDTTIDTATDQELLDTLVVRGVLEEEWFVALHALRDAEVLGRWVMSTEVQAQAVAAEWRDDSGANYVVERHLGCATFVIVPTAPSTPIE